MDHTAFGYIVPTTFDADGPLIDVGSVSDEDGNQTVRMHRNAPNETVFQQPIPDVMCCFSSIMRCMAPERPRTVCLR